ncbi:MAG TPA: TetR/AcrR family transcriptional regulator [Rudaea sp.]
MRNAPESKKAFLNAAMHVFRVKGYEGTSVDDLCSAAQLTKGSFFHHFAGKEEFAIAAVDHFAAGADALFTAAPYQALADPLARVLAYVDFRASLLEGELADFTCLFGMMVQETYATHPAIRDTCERHLAAHAAMLTKDLAEAKRRYAPRARWTPESVADYMVATIQGAFILAKARNSADAAAECLTHLRRYLQSLFPTHPRKGD